MATQEAYTVQVLRIQFARDAERGEDGAARYLILSPCAECVTNPGHHVCEAHPGMVHHYERQAFRRGAFGHRPNATPEEIRSDRANVWGWDGNTEAPSLTPSFLAKQGRPYLMHAYLTAGQLVLCGDSTITLHPNPQQCEEWQE